MSIKNSKQISRSRPSSPVHLFVDKDTPVHVYMDKGDRDPYNSDFNAPKSHSIKSTKMKRPRKPGSNVPTSRLMRSPNERVRSMSPPWVPPPGKTTKTLKSPLGSYWNEDEADLSQEDRYMQQITNLQNEVGELREQLKYEKQCDQLRDTQDAIDCQGEKLEELKQEIDVMEKENHLLRDSLEKTRSNLNLNSDSERLVQILIETELAGERCAHQMQHVFDCLRNIMTEGHKVSSRDIDRISTLFHDTESRLFDFKSLSNSLRDLLKIVQLREISGQNSTEKENLFLLKIRSELDDNISKLELELLEKEKIIDDLKKQLTNKNDESINFASTHESLENIKGHLQQQLKQKSGDCNRLSVQIRTLESELAKERLDKEHLIELLKNPKDREYDDRGVLKKAARAQKQRALKAEETVQQLTSILTAKERHIEQLMHSKTTRNHASAVSNHCDHCPEANKHHHKNDDLPIQTYWPSAQFGHATRTRHHGRRHYGDYQDHDSSDSFSNTLCQNDRALVQSSKSFVNQFVQCEINSQEDQEKLRHLEDIYDENQHLHQQMANNDQEEIIFSLKKENENLRSIADQCESRLRDVEREMKNVRRTMAEENDDKSEEQVNKLSKILEKLEMSEKSNQSSQIRIEDLERKLKNLESQNFEMKNVLQQKDSSFIDNKCKAEELARENASLMRQLEAALTDSKRNSDNARDKNVGRDRQLQSRIHEIESQLAHQKAESNKWHRNCEETERKCNTKLQDMKIQLEQSEITNRSMQTYVQFLKKSYANVFGDMPLSNGLSCPNPSYMGQSLSFNGF